WSLLLLLVLVLLSHLQNELKFYPFLLFQLLLFLLALLLFLIRQSLLLQQILRLPVMLGASLVKLLGFGFSFTPEELIVLAAGCITSFLVSIVAIKFLMNYIQNNDFSSFGWYRIIVGVLVILYFSFA